jgi:ferredoxin
MSSSSDTLRRLAGLRRRAATGSGGALTVVVDPVRCQGVGMCAHLAPGVIALDSWGYPMVPRHPVTGRERSAARSAASGCPRRALLLEESPGR